VLQVKISYGEGAGVVYCTVSSHETVSGSEELEVSEAASVGIDGVAEIDAHWAAFRGAPAFVTLSVNTVSVKSCWPMSPLESVACTEKLYG
jgi:hypothetical protein